MSFKSKQFSKQRTEAIKAHLKYTEDSNSKTTPQERSNATVSLTHCLLIVTFHCSIFATEGYQNNFIYKKGKWWKCYFFFSKKKNKVASHLHRNYNHYFAVYIFLRVDISFRITKFFMLIGFLFENGNDLLYYKLKKW